MPIPPRKVIMICGFIAWPLLMACTFMLQYEGRVPVGSGVAESGGRTSDEEVAAVVTVTGVEAGVPDDRDSGWVQTGRNERQHEEECQAKDQSEGHTRTCIPPVYMMI